MSRMFNLSLILGVILVVAADDRSNPRPRATFPPPGPA